MSIATALTALANDVDAAKAAITAKGGTAPIGAADMADAIAAIPSGGVEDIEWHQCPQLVRDYLDNVTYNPNDYTTSQIANYAPAVAAQSNTKPIGKTVDGVTFYNEIPNAKTPFATQNKAGTLKPLDKLRWINSQTDNMRDLGGWDCDGGTIKYGKLFRGGECAAADKELALSLGLRHELNLRGNEIPMRNYSVWGVGYTQFSTYAWNVNDQPVWADILHTVFDCVNHNIPLFFHCAAGADRTGAVALVIEAILGVSQSDCDKDYELTCFYSGTGTDVNARRRNEADWKNSINYIKSVPIPTGVEDTFRNHAIYFVAGLGFTAEEINAFRAAMIDGNPDTIELQLTNYSVANTLANCTTSNTANTVKQYQGYDADITPDAGYVISNLSITMGGIDVTNQCWDGNKTILNNSVTNTLTNCVTSNDRNWAVSGQSYVADITADDGYTLVGATVSITMGGIDVSNYYSNGKIAIPKVTGNIVINITAVPSVVPITNLVDTIGYAENTRISTSSGANKTDSASGLSSFGSTNTVDKMIPISAGDVIRVKGVTFPASVANAAYVVYSSSAQLNNSGYLYTSNTHIGGIMDITYNGDLTTFSIAQQLSSEYKYVRICGICDKPADVIITRNEVIS